MGASACAVVFALYVPTVFSPCGLWEAAKVMVVPMTMVMSWQLKLGDRTTPGG
ncbi:MAG: hypothetical protein AAFQ74_05290 [Cyanobacteria bacterium J06623_4]